MYMIICRYKPTRNSLQSTMNDTAGCLWQRYETCILLHHIVLYLPIVDFILDIGDLTVYMAMYNSKRVKRVSK